jgi:membrane-bound lytic murein transglycosylase MltF
MNWPTRLRRARRWLWLALFVSATACSAVPPQAAKYRLDLIRTAHQVWGYRAPIPAFAAQIHQESAWNPGARSAYAAGLTQFTPETAEWIQKVYGVELGRGGVLNPQWAIRAMVRYDRHLWDTLGAFGAECDRMAATLASYNGGRGWITRDQALAKAAGADPGRWWENVEKYTARADWARRENRDYPRRILLRHQPIYFVWGGKRLCQT